MGGRNGVGHPAASTNRAIMALLEEKRQPALAQSATRRKVPLNKVYGAALPHHHPRPTSALTSSVQVSMLGAVRGAEAIPLINGASKSACM